MSIVTSPLREIAAAVRALATQQQGNYLELLELLRLLEALHQEIRDDFFQPALPTNRQALYSLLRDIELAGGWPYIPRMKLQEFLAALEDTGKEADFTTSIDPTSMAQTATELTAPVELAAESATTELVPVTETT